METYDGVGPYQMSPVWEDCGDLHGWPTFAEEDPELHPHPQHDGFCESDSWFERAMYRVPQEMSFGFTREDDLVRWFFPHSWDAELLEKYGLCVRVFEVGDEHVIEGYSQAMFRKDLAEMVDEFLPLEYIDTRTI